MKTLARVLDALPPVVIGFLLGSFLVAYGLSQNPLVSTIIDAENNGLATRFTVDCKAAETGRVTCGLEAVHGD